MAEEHDNVETDAFGARHDPETGELLEIVAPLDDGEEEAEEPIAAFVPVQPDMLLGEMRDHILGAIKRTPVWKGLDERAKRDLANEVEQASRSVIRGAVRIAAGMGLDAIEVTISKPTLTDKRQIEAKILCLFEAKSWAAMPEHGKRTLVFADAETLMGARAAAVEKDQPGLFDGAEAPDAKVAEDADTLGGEAAKVLGDLLPPKIKAAADRGRALRLEGGAFKIPPDLEGKPGEVAAFEKSWVAADKEGGKSEVEPVKAPRSERDPETGETYHDGAKPPVRAPRIHRARRQAETAEA